ncbi:MAG: helix-turn-helix domain-containing protein [Geobacter sp.]|nr:MAG: helix-turn-helix domain-containing protein [Geobacter sp.]
MSEASIHTIKQKTIGSRLREARERKGLSLEDVARTTRISRGYLKALEEDDSDKLPSEAYAKGFLRVYAQFLNVAAEELVVPSDHCSAGGQKAGEHGNSTTIGCCSALSPQARTVLQKVLPFVLVVLLIISALFFCFSPENPLAPQTVSLTSEPLEEKIAVGSVQENSNVVRDEKTLPLFQKSDEKVLSARFGQSGEKFVLRLRAVEDGSLNLTIDEMTTQHYDLKAGDLIEWKGEKSFSLDLENAGGVEAELNGKLLKPFGKKGASAHIVLSGGYNGGKAE